MLLIVELTQQRIDLFVIFIIGCKLLMPTGCQVLKEGGK
jgi:hypothetical protein